MTVREALLSLGYAERKPGMWLKPIGFQCFSFHEETGTWFNWFAHATTGEILLWETKKFQDERAGPSLYQLKNWECFTRTSMFGNGDSHFELAVFDL